jgi:hypothetical protein
VADSTTPIDLILSDQAQKEITANAALNAASPAMLYARRATATSGLTWGYYGGRWAGAVGDGLISNSQLTLTASTTNYIVVLRSSGAVSVSTSPTNWNNAADYMRLYLVSTSSTQVTSYQDHRQCYGGTSGGGASSFTGLSDTPANYTGAGGQFVRVNPGATALEFIVPPAGTGDVIGPASSTDNALPRFDGAGGKNLQASGVLVGDDNQISGYRGDLNAQTGTTYTLVAADTGKVVESTNAAAITLTLPATAAVGFCCTVVQGGAGQVTLTPASGATLRNRQSHTRTAGQWAGVTLYVRTNAGGSAAEYVMLGDSAT